MIAELIVVLPCNTWKDPWELNGVLHGWK